MKLRRSYSQHEIDRVLQRLRHSETSERRELDWEQIHQRLAAVRAATAQDDEVDSQVLEQVWARNAAQVAARTTEEDVGQLIDLLLVKLGRETYGLDVAYIFKIEPAERVTPVPRVPDWVAGVVNLRGRIFSAVDLRRFFNLPEASQIVESEDTPSDELESTGYLVIVETPDMEVALLTDDVLDVKSLPVDHLQETSSTVRGIPMEYVRGLMSDADNDLPEDDVDAPLIVVLDLPALLADKRLVIREEIV